MKYLYYIFTMITISMQAQIVNINDKLWERPETLHNNTIIDTVQLLNFHPKISIDSLKEEIAFNKKKGHTLAAVHTIYISDSLWRIKETDQSLYNNLYKKSDSIIIPINIRPSIFLYTSPSIPKISSINDSLHFRKNNRNIYETLFIPKKISKKDAQKIQSYLSLKYGISLLNTNYYNSKGDIIWNLKDNVDYKYRPTGVGRDDGNLLYQKQSFNQEDQLLTIGLSQIEKTNKKNLSILNDDTFVIWSDNNAPLTFNTNGVDYILDRIWKVNMYGSLNYVQKYSFTIKKNIFYSINQPIEKYNLSFDYGNEIISFEGQVLQDEVLFTNVFFKSNTKDCLVKFGVKTSAREISEKQGRSTIVTTEKNLQDILLYPNPSKQNETFNIVFKPMDNVTIEIFDSSGKKISSEKLEKQATFYSSQLQIQGNYIINVLSKDTIIKTFKLIVH